MVLYFRKRKHLKVTFRVLWFTDYGLSLDWAGIDHRLNRLWKHLCVPKIIPYKVKINKIAFCMVPKSVRFNHILPFHRLILLGQIYQGSNFSAHGLKSAPERSNLIIFEISVNLVKKYFAYGGVGVTLSCHGFSSIFSVSDCQCSASQCYKYQSFRGLRQPLYPGRFGSHDRAFQPLKPSPAWNPVLSVYTAGLIRKGSGDNDNQDDDDDE